MVNETINGNLNINEPETVIAICDLFKQRSNVQT